MSAAVDATSRVSASSARAEDSADARRACSVGRASVSASVRFGFKLRRARRNRRLARLERALASLERFLYRLQRLRARRARLAHGLLPPLDGVVQLAERLLALRRRRLARLGGGDARRGVALERRRRGFPRGERGDPRGDVRAERAEFGRDAVHLPRAFLPERVRLARLRLRRRRRREERLRVFLVARERRLAARARGFARAGHGGEVAQHELTRLDVRLSASHGRLESLERVRASPRVVRHHRRRGFASRGDALTFSHSLGGGAALALGDGALARAHGSLAPVEVRGDREVSRARVRGGGSGGVRLRGHRDGVRGARVARGPRGDIRHRQRGLALRRASLPGAHLRLAARDARGGLDHLRGRAQGHGRATGAGLNERRRRGRLRRDARSVSRRNSRRRRDRIGRFGNRPTGEAHEVPEVHQRRRVRARRRGGGGAGVVVHAAPSLATCLDGVTPVFAVSIDGSQARALFRSERFSDSRTRIWQQLPKTTVTIRRIP
jgi:hypothetical protein